VSSLQGFSPPSHLYVGKVAKKEHSYDIFIMGNTSTLNWNFSANVGDCISARSNKEVDKTPILFWGGGCLSKAIRTAAR